MNIRFLASIAVLGITLSPLLPGVAHSEPSEGKIALVDMQRIITESIIGKAAQSDLQEDAKKRELKLQQTGSELKGLGEQLEKQGSVLSKEALEQKREEVAKKQRELERSIQDQREAIARKRDQALVKVVTEAKKVVQEVSAAKHYRFVIEKDPQFVLYADQALDITEEVLKALDNKKTSL